MDCINDFYQPNDSILMLSLFEDCFIEN